MIPEVRTTPDGRQFTGQHEPPSAEPPPASPSDVVEETRQEAPPLATPPAPPDDTKGTRRQPTPSGRRWALALGLVVVGAFLVGVLVPFGSGLDVLAMPMAILFGAMCLVAGWLLRSWWGLIAIPIVYTAVAALMRDTFVGNAPPEVGVLTGRFALTVIAPAVVLSAIGAAIGMYRARATPS